MAITTDASLTAARHSMVQQLRRQRGIEDEHVLDAMLQVERHRFVDVALWEKAYGPYTLPIGAGQRLPHPDTVAVMSEALHLRGHERILDIGTGSGYQTALLARLGNTVCSLERLPFFVETASARLREMGYDNVDVRQGTSLRWPVGGLFEAIHVTAAVPEVPGVLFAQLAPGGRLVLPVGRSPHQRLMLFLRKGAAVSCVSLGACRFLPARGRPPGAP